MTSVLLAGQPYVRRPLPLGLDRGGAIDANFQRIQSAMPQPGQIIEVTGDYTVQDADEWLLVDASAAAVTVTIPDAYTVPGGQLTLKKTDSSSNAVTLGATIDGAASPTLTAQYASRTIRSDGTAWWVVASV